MKKFKKLTMTLALLLTAVTGAWATDGVIIKELTVPSEWKDDNTSLTVDEMTGFKDFSSLTDDEAKALLNSVPTGKVIIIYGAGASSNSFKLVEYNGTIVNVGEIALPHVTIFSFNVDHKFYYTASDAIEVTPVAEPAANTKQWTFTMPAFNVELTPIYAPEFTATFKAGNSNTIQGGKATVAVTESGATEGTQVTLDENGKLTPLYEGQTITMTAAAGYKFRKVEVKKGGALLSFEIGGHVTATIYYFEGETWEQAIQNHPTENSAWKINYGHITGNGVNLFAGDNYVNVNPNDTINPNANYHLLWT